MKIKRFRKKPIVIEAIQWTGDNYYEICEFCDTLLNARFETVQLIIPTLEGDHIADKNDWIIKGINNEFYPCKPDIFAKTYDEVLE
jgi:hypothetical protein